MSGYFAQRLNDRVVILSDAAHYDRQLVIRRIHTKIDELGAFGAVAVSRGTMDITTSVTTALKMIVNTADTFDAAMEGVRAGFSIIDPNRRQKPFEIIVAGWSETCGPALFAYTNTQVEGLEPFVLHQIDGAINNGYVLSSANVAALTSRGGIDDFAIELFEQQRRIISKPITPDSAAGHIIGGFLERADVTAKGTSRTIIHRWPDVVGQRIVIDEAAAA